MLKALAFALCLSATAGSSLIMSAPAGAADDMMMKMDCSKASSMMMDANKMSTMSMTPSGDTDKDFMALMMEREKGTNKMLHIEAMCGKDDKMKSMAMKQAQESDQRMTEFRNLGMSQ